MNKETLRMQMLAGIITEGQYKAKLNENEEYVPYQFDDEKGKELYLKYDKSYENPSWTRGDFPNSKEIDLQTLLDITGMSLEELKELKKDMEELEKRKSKTKGLLTASIEGTIRGLLTGIITSGGDVGVIVKSAMTWATLPVISYGLTGEIKKLL
jgi:hypothetical protein